MDVTLEVGYGASKGDSAYAVGAEAAKEAIKGIDKRRISAMLIFASVRYNLEELLRGIHNEVGEVPLLGATTAGEICNGQHRESVVVVALASPYLRVRVGVGQGVSRDWQQAVIQAVSVPEVAPFFSLQDSSIWPELTLQGKSVFGLLFTPGNTRVSDSRSFEILEELKRLSTGRVPLFGGAAADDWRLETNYVLWGQRAYPDSMLVAIFETQLRFGLAMAHGFRPTNQIATVTSTSNHQVLELDGQPAAEIYSRMQGTSQEALAGKHLTLATGRPVGTSVGYGEYSINVASFFTPAGGVRFAQPVSEGTVLAIMEGNPDDLLSAGPAAFHKALLHGHISDPALTLVFPCALRSQLLGDKDHEAIHNIQTLAPKMPIAGFYSFGEHGLTDEGINRHNNYMVTILVIDRQLSYGAQVALENERLRGDLVSYIDELKKAEEALGQSEEKFRGVFNNARDGILLADIKTKMFILGNEMISQMLGYSFAELFKMKVEDIHPQENLPEVLDRFDKLVRGDTIFVTDIPVKRRDGSIFYADINSFLIELTGNTYVVGFFRDITERKRAEEELLKSEEQYRQLVQQVPAVVYKGYTDWSLECFDQKIEEITGYSMEEFNTRKKTWMDLILSEDIDQAKKLLLEAREGDGSYVTEHRIRKKNGEVRWVQAMNRIIYDSKSKIDHISGVFFDITDRKSLEEERDRLFNMSMDMLCVAGFDGFFKQINPAWSKTLGWPETELLSRSWLDFVHPEDRLATIAAGDRLRKGNPVIQFENRYQCQDGSYRWISWNSFPLQEEKLMFGVARDITEKRNMEEQLLKAQKMEAVGRLAGGVAHDFNNLLTAIMGYSEIMMVDLRKEDPLYSLLEEITKATLRGAQLTNQLLAFSRKQILQPRVINLNDVVIDIDKMLRRLIGEDIDLIALIDEELDLVKVDPSQIEQIIMNLAINARDAMPQGGRLTIETANVYLDKDYAGRHEGVTPGPHVMLAIRDNGVGMDADTFAHIFEPFYTTKEIGKGTGLGLATVYGIVKQSGGHIWVYSEPGQGTTFKVYLPRVEEKIKDLKSKSAAPTPLEGKETILVVEDDAALRELTSIGLRKYGFKVLEAAQGGEALLICEQEKAPIDLMLTDVVMPKISGSVLAERLKLVHPKMKVLYMSGYTENAIVHHGVLDSKVNFIAKPFRVQALVQKVREVLDTP
jgi:PAS domain S-box-containing protein